MKKGRSFSQSQIHYSYTPIVSLVKYQFEIYNVKKIVLLSQLEIVKDVTKEILR